jgi:SPX domain protein involved in polyphosphate accumulation
MSAQPPVSLEQREKEFVEALDSELAKIIRFYLKKEAEINAKFQELSMQVQHAEGIQPEQQAAGEGGGGCHAVAFACGVRSADAAC